MTVPPLEDLAARARRLVAAAPTGRTLLGIAGPPGSGKSTLAAALVERLGPSAVCVPMDGFHLAGSRLAALGRADRKGAPDTFDTAGYRALLRRLRDEVGPAGETVHAPEFRREVEEAVAGAIAVPPTVSLVVTEGNYLLLEDDGWAGVRPLLDAVWYLEVDDEVRRGGLVARHVAHGRSGAAARAWVREVDEPNAVRVAATRARADLVVRRT